MAEVTIDDEVMVPEEQLPDLPGELCGIWAYIQWEAAGCPNRSQADSDAAFQHAIQVKWGCCLLAHPRGHLSICWPHRQLSSRIPLLFCGKASCVLYLCCLGPM